MVSHLEKIADSHKKKKLRSRSHVGSHVSPKFLVHMFLKYLGQVFGKRKLAQRHKCLFGIENVNKVAKFVEIVPIKFKNRESSIAMHGFKTIWTNPKVGAKNFLASINSWQCFWFKLQCVPGERNGRKDYKTSVINASQRVWNGPEGDFGMRI